MADAASYVKTAQVTHACSEIRRWMRIEIKKDEFIGIARRENCASHSSLEEFDKIAFELVIDEDSEIITILYGEDVIRKKLRQLNNMLRKASTMLKWNCTMASNRYIHTSSQLNKKLEQCAE